MPVKVQGLNAVLNNIKKILPSEAAIVNSRLSAAGEILDTAVRKNASLTDHTLSQLADMGHPYSKRYAVNSGPHDDSIVHNQTGKIYDNIEKQENLNTVHSTVEVGVSESKVLYIGDLIAGTTKQRPRNFIGEAFREKIGAIIASTQGK